MTLSVLVVDWPAGLMGVAVATHPQAVGSRVPALLPGIGVAVTQGVTEVSLAERALAACAGGASPDEALDGVLAGDRHAPWRQVAVLTVAGGAAVRTGASSFGECCSHAADDVLVVGNMLRGGGAGPAAVEAFGLGIGTTAERLVAALGAGDTAGGDRRGATSAALLVGPISPASSEPVLDLRVDGDPDPIGALHRLVSEHVVHAAVGRLMAAACGTGQSVTHEEVGSMLGERDRSRSLATDLTFWAGAALAVDGDPAAGALLGEALLADSGWRSMLDHLVRVGRVPADVAAP